MAVEREKPHHGFSFRVTVDELRGTGSFTAGFEEISELGSEITLAKYRNSNDLKNHVRKIHGMNKATDITLKRGVIGSLNILDWITATRKGDPDARRLVTIELWDEAPAEAVMTWKLVNAKPVKYTGPTLNAKGGSDVAVEELVLTFERIDLD